MLDRLDQALLRNNRHQRPVGVVFIDLGNFKLVKDGLGHDAGDALLQRVAERLHETTRAGDTLARFGGDEFVVLLEDVANASKRCPQPTVWRPPCVRQYTSKAERWLSRQVSALP